MNRSSLDLYEKSKHIMPGGVNSPVRAFGNVGLAPLFIKKAEGSKITDVDGNEYIDYVGSWGTAILGHADIRVVDAVKKAAKNGTSFGAPTENEYILARMIIDAIPSVEMIRMVNSGTEAVMSALRLARGYTNREKVLKFEGCYHGHFDDMLVKAGSGALTTGRPDSAGVPVDHVANTIVSGFNDCDQLKKVFERYGDSLAAVIVEPVAANMGVILPQNGFLELLRELTYKHGVLLIFDEVITGFRVSYSGAQGYYGITPDLTVLGKIIGGGMPVGAFGGRKDIMEMVSPAGPVYQAGTLSGNPVATAAGIMTLRILKNIPECYKTLDAAGGRLEEAFVTAGKKKGVPVTVNRAGSLLSVFFTDVEVTDHRSASGQDTKIFAGYFKSMLDNAIYLAPSGFESMFISLAHSKTDLEVTEKAILDSFGSIHY